MFGWDLVPLATGLALLGEIGLGSGVGSGHLSRSCQHGETAEGDESEASPNRAVNRWALHLFGAMCHCLRQEAVCQS